MTNPQDHRKAAFAASATSHIVQDGLSSAINVLLPILLGAVSQGSSSITYGFAADLIHPARMARGYALLYSAGGFSAAAGPFLFGILADGFGIETAVYAMAGAALLAAPPIFLLPVKKPEAA